MTCPPFPLATIDIHAKPFSQIRPRIIVSLQRKTNCALVCVGNDVFVRDEEYSSQLGARLGALSLVLEDESRTDGAFRLDAKRHEQEMCRCRLDFHRIPHRRFFLVTGRALNLARGGGISTGG